jgi:hypothetical protein
LYLPLQLHAALVLHSPPHFLAQRLDVGAGGVAEVEQEIGVLLAHLRAADLQATAPGFVDQSPCLVSGRVLEGGTAGLGAQRLAGLALAAMRSISAWIVAGSPASPRNSADTTIA